METEEEKYLNLKLAFKKTFHKKLDRLQWEHKYFVAIAIIHDIEGMIGLRERDDTLPKQKDKVKE